ncbi:MAG: hypothetical protein HUU57_02350 [Bdellovibrio sp.]|nr:hypothetical protein [Bdellovibrio sp.]
MNLTEKYPDIFKVEEFPRIYELFGSIPVLEYPAETQHKDSLSENILVVNDESLPELVQPIFSQKAFHVVRKSASLFRLELIVAGLMILKHETFYNDPATLLLKFFKLQQSGDNMQVQRHEIKSTTEAPAVLSALRGVLPVNTGEAQAVEIGIVLDELISNALFNAPIDRHKKHLFKGRSRGEDFALPSGHSIIIQMASSPTHLMILVKDSFGSIDAGGLLRRLRQIYSDNEPPTPRVGLGGAGLGLKMVLDRVESLYLMSVPEKYTFAGALIPLNKGMKKMFATPKNLHLGLST